MFRWLRQPFKASLKGEATPPLAACRVATLPQSLTVLANTATDACASTEICYSQIRPLALQVCKTRRVRGTGSIAHAAKGQSPRGSEGLRIARLIYVGIAGAALSACATPTITRSCLTREQYEQLKTSEPPHVKSKLTGKADEDVRPLAGSALELRAWGHALLDTLRICSENKP